MNKLLANNLNVIVNIQYGIGFDLIEGKIEIEITIFNKTQKSRSVFANRNRINFYEEFIWKIDRATLKYSRTTNEIVKIECFTTPEICYGNIYRRQRIGHLVVKLKEFQVIGRDFNQCISTRSYKLQGSNNYYEFRIVLIIQEDLGFENFKQSKKNLGFNYNSNFTNGKQSLGLDQNDSIKIRSTKTFSANQERVKIHELEKRKEDRTNKMNESDINRFDNMLDKQDLQFHETLNKCGDLLNNLNNNENKINKSRKKGMQYELNTMKKKIDQSIKESKESLKSNDYNESKLSELLATCLKHTEEWLKIMKKIKKDLENPKKYSSNSSTQSESDLERPIVLAREIKNKLNELTQYMVSMNEKIKNSKVKRSQEISNLKKTNSILSELCNNYFQDK